MGFGSVKNVGISAVDGIVEERKRNGAYKSFTDFCERVIGETVNKKCIESLIKAGAFDELGENRATLIASFEGILDTINNETKKAFKGQVTMFDITEDETTQKNKYVFNRQQEFTEKELLSMEKEMLGIYISGHPLDKLRDKINKIANINTLKMLEMKEENNLSQDGRNVKYVGIITSVKKKYTKNNTIMAFVTIEDLYGTCEIIVFDSCYNRNSQLLIAENIVLVEGRLSIREDEDIKIVANNIVDINSIAEVNNVQSLKDRRTKELTLDITNLEEEKKAKLRGMIRFFAGDRNNMPLKILDNGVYKPCGAIYATEEIIQEFEDVIGKERVIRKII